MEPTNQLIENITNLFDEKGKTWLNTLPTILEALAASWQLTSMTPVDNMTFNYVAKAIFKNQLVVLKVSFDEASIMDEKKALNYFDGNASIRLIDYNQQYHALLLQQAVPGTTLKSFYPMEVEFVMDCYVRTMQELHNKPFPTKHDFRHISDWLKAIDKAMSDSIPKELLNKAIHLKNKLLSSPSKQFVLHGDLHHDNILKDGDDWLAIDPKGIIGEAAFEIAAFDFISNREMADRQDIKKLFDARIELISNQSDLDYQRIKDWVFVRLILSAVWSIEDNCDPSWAIELASYLH
jgi:streptomycin 6-kinase